jgi:hypothetical protein
VTADLAGLIPIRLLSASMVVEMSLTRLEGLEVDALRLLRLTPGIGPCLQALRQLQ